MKKVAVITSGFLPIPASKGGAVENLIDIFNQENEKYKKIKLVIFSCYDYDAYKVSKKYKNAEFIYIKSNVFIECLDKIIFWIVEHIFKKKNSRSYRYILKRLHFYLKASYYLKINDYDKIILENHPSMYLILKFRKNYEKYDGRYYYHCHNEFPSCYGCYNIIKNTKKFISVSNFRSINIKNYLKLNSNKFSVLLNCCDSKAILKEATEKEKMKIKSKFNIKEDDKVIIFIGRIIPEKGVLELIKAIKRVQYEHYKLLIIGASLNSLNVRTQYEKEVEKNIVELKDKISIVGFVNHDELYKYYSIADISVIPSIWDDSAPLTVIESMICGIPIITTKSGGIPEYVDENCACILERDDNLVNNMSNSIDELLKEDEIRRKMKKSCILKAKSFTEFEYYDKFVELIK